MNNAVGENGEEGHNFPGNTNSWQRKHQRQWFENSWWLFGRRRNALLRGCLIGILATGVASFGIGGEPEEGAKAGGELFQPVDGANNPMGSGKGIFPGRVVWDYAPGATAWDGETGYWWEPENTDLVTVKKMLSRSLQKLTGKTTDKLAWEAIFRHFNQTHERGGRPYQDGEKIAIKANLNCSGGYNWGNGLNNSPQMVFALLEQLVRKAGVGEEYITVYDASRVLGNPVWELCHQRFPEVHFVDRTGEKGREKAEPRKGPALHYADDTVAGSGKTFFPVCVVEADYLINLALLKGHTLAGVTFNAKNHFGSVWRESRKEAWNDGWAPRNMHETIAVHDHRDHPKRKMGSYNPLVEIMAHRQLGGKTLLYLIEGLYGAQKQGGEPIRWQSNPFDGGWTSSLLVSQDPVAIESVALDFCRTEQRLSVTVRGNVDNYLHEAANAGNPPSGTTYDPEGDDEPVQGSLGVHEHWNSGKEKNYSRNLGKNAGIELIRTGEEK